jgi:impB/mucB/samB family C-terminal domain
MARHKLEARRVSFVLRTQDFRHTRYELVFSRPTNVPSVIVPLINAPLDTIYRPERRYRLTDVALAHLRGEGETQLDLFGECLRPSGCSASMTALTVWIPSMANIPCSWGPALPVVRIIIVAFSPLQVIGGFGSPY